MGLEPNRVYRLELPWVNAYLVRDDGSLTLVDAGTPWDVERVRDRFEAAGFDPADVDRVLLTHYDLDHVGTLAELDLDARVHVADPDGGFLSGTASPPLGNHKGLFQRLTRPLLDRPDLPLEAVEDGDRIGPFVAHRTPGHTPGHTAYVHEEYGTAFVGDLVRRVDGDLAASPWVMSYDAAENRRSVRRLADRLRSVEVVAMGHGTPVREGGGDALRRLADRK
jgi:glyoxylase-like metal-dependent hydrolase (beta-lactamase superfamily II)